jgi:arylsulfatase A-like enzyme
VNYHDLWRNRTEIFEDGQYLTERIAAEAKQFIAKNKANPFFLYAPFNAPHYPMHAPEKYMQRFPGLDPERRTYAAMIAALDDGVGEIMAAVKQAGVLENTMVVFIGDNGATVEKRAGLNQDFAKAGNNGPFRGFKFSLFDGGMHVPGIMSWPGTIPARQQIRELAMSMDILPTICKAAGASLPEGYTVNGSDILPVATSQAKSPHPAIFWAQGGQLATRRGPWKLVVGGILFNRTPDSGKMTGDDTVFLSNLDQDPGESTNLRHKHPEIVDELQTSLNTWFAALKPEKD